MLFSKISAFSGSDSERYAISTAIHLTLQRNSTIEEVSPLYVHFPRLNTPERERVQMSSRLLITSRHRCNTLHWTQICMFPLSIRIVKPLATRVSSSSSLSLSFTPRRFTHPHFAMASSTLSFSLLALAYAFSLSKHTQHIVCVEV